MILSDFIDTVCTYLTNDPFRILYIIGGTGGIFYYLDRCKNRIRIKTVLLREFFEESTQKHIVTFEVENLGAEVTSLKKEIIFNALTPKKNSRRIVFEIASDRTLYPHVPKQIEAKSKEAGLIDDLDNGMDLAFYFFKQYKLNLTKGCSKKMRFRIYKHQLGYIKYQIEKILFKLTGKYCKTEYS